MIDAPAPLPDARARLDSHSARAACDRTLSRDFTGPMPAHYGAWIVSPIKTSFPSGAPCKNVRL
jgi:hypothetical protein